MPFGKRGGSGGGTPPAQVQSDFLETDTGSPAYILNRDRNALEKTAAPLTAGAIIVADVGGLLEESAISEDATDLTATKPFSAPNINGAAESTSLKSGGEITADTATTFNLSAGEGERVFVDALGVATVVNVTWSAKTGVTIPNIAGQESTIVGLDENGDFVDLSFPMTDEMIRTFIICGFITHAAGTVDVIVNDSLRNRNTYSQHIDTLNSFGVIRRRGLAVTPNADLTIQKSAGQLESPGAGAASGSAGENIVNISQGNPAIFSRLLGRTATAENDSTTGVDNGFYDDGSGVKIALAQPNDATIVYLCQSIDDAAGGLIYVYGQTVYPNLDSAILNSPLDKMIFPPALENRSVLIERIAITRDATNLQDDTKVAFLGGVKYGLSVTDSNLAAGSGGGDVSGGASSAEDEIATYSDTTGKNIKSQSRVSAYIGNLQSTIVNGALRMIPNGVGQVSLGNASSAYQFNAGSLTGEGVFSVAGASGFETNYNLEIDAAYVGSFGHTPLSNTTYMVGKNGISGTHVFDDGRISLGNLEDEPDFGVLVSTLGKPLGLPLVGTSEEGGLTGRKRQIHFNDDLNRVRYWDGSQYQSVASLNDAATADIDPLSTVLYVDGTYSGLATPTGAINKPFKKLSEAIASITSPTLLNQTVLLISPGVYDEGIDIVVPPYVYLVGYSSRIATTIDDNVEFTCDGINYAENITFQGNTKVINPPALSIANTEFKGCSFASGAMTLTGREYQSSVVNMFNCIVNNNVTATDIRLLLDDCSIDANITLTTLAAGSRMELNNCIMPNTASIDLLAPFSTSETRVTNSFIEAPVTIATSAFLFADIQSASISTSGAGVYAILPFPSGVITNPEIGSNSLFMTANQTGGTGVLVKMHAGTGDPNGTVTGDGRDFYFDTTPGIGNGGLWRYYGTGGTNNEWEKL